VCIYVLFNDDDDDDCNDYEREREKKSGIKQVNIIRKSDNN
jgi:hypothetical protein